MNSVPISVGMIVRDNHQNIAYRIVYLDAETQYTWLCRIDDNSWPFPMATYRLREELDSEKGNYAIEYNDPWIGTALYNKSAEKQTRADKRHQLNWDLIEPLVRNENQRLILNKRNRKILIDARLSEIKSSYQVIARLIKQYWKRGMNYGAIRNGYANCGAAGKSRILGDKKVGAPRKISPEIGINATIEERRNLRIAADYYLNQKKPNPTLQDALDYIIRLKYSRQIVDEKGHVIYKVSDARPTLRQLQWYIKTNFSDKYVIRRRSGDKHWNLQERELLGAADNDVQGPGQRFEIDATVADAYLNSQFDRRRIVGRPIIYFIIDAWSRLIAGLYVGFEGPSWVGAMMALINMVMPKITFCAQYGIHIDEWQWPSHIAPMQIMADRGELMSVSLGNNIVQNLGINIDNVSPGRGDLKPLVERRFGSVPAKFRPFVPGYVLKDFNERGTPDYRLEATLNLYEFTQMVIYAVLEHNSTPIRGKNLPAEMITDGSVASPIELWQWGIINRSGYTIMRTVEEVALNVLPSKEVRVTAHGIHFGQDIYYSSQTALREEWFSKARRKEWKVKIAFDPRDMGYAYLLDPKLPHGFEVCNLLNRSEQYSNKSLFEIEELDAARKIAEAANQKNLIEMRIDYDAHMAAIRDEAKKATKAVCDPDASKGERTAGIRQNRSQEKEIQRSAESVIIGEGSIVETKTKNASKSLSLQTKANDLDLLKQIRAKSEKIDDEHKQ